MSSLHLETAISQIAGPSSLPLLRHVLERCQSSRYGWRNRREEQLGALVSSWRELQATAQQTSDLLNSRSSQSLTYNKPNRSLLQEASHLSQTFLATLASALRMACAMSPIGVQEGAARFLETLFTQYDVPGLLDDLQSMIERLAHLIASLHPQDEWMEPEVIEDGRQEPYEYDYEIEESPPEDAYEPAVQRPRSITYGGRATGSAYGGGSGGHYTVSRSHAGRVPPPAPSPPSAGTPRQAVYMQSSNPSYPPPGYGYEQTAARAVYPQLAAVPRGYTRVRPSASY